MATMSQILLALDADTLASAREAILAIRERVNDGEYMVDFDRAIRRNGNAAEKVAALREIISARHRNLFRAVRSVSRRFAESELLRGSASAHSLVQRAGVEVSRFRRPANNDFQLVRYQRVGAYQFDSRSVSTRTILSEERRIMIERVFRRAAPLAQRGASVQSISQTVLSDLTRAFGMRLSESYGTVARIVRTELKRNFQAGLSLQQRNLQSAGVNLRRQWITANDERTRERHLKLHRKFESDDGTFNAGIYRPRYPGAFGEPSQDINCRCTVILAIPGMGNPELGTIGDARERINNIIS